MNLADSLPQSEYHVVASGRMGEGREPTQVEGKSMRKIYPHNQVSQNCFQCLNPPSEPSQAGLLPWHCRGRVPDKPFPCPRLAPSCIRSWGLILIFLARGLGASGEDGDPG